MGRPPCCDKSNVKRGLWTAEEDAKILAYVAKHGIGNWTLVPQKAGLNRCGKSCRLRWTNYLRPDLKHDNFTPEEEQLILDYHKAVGSRWSLIAKQLPGRTDNDVKNHWNTKLKKKLSKMGIDPVTHKPFSQILSDYGKISGLPNTGNRIDHPPPNISINNMPVLMHQTLQPERFQDKSFPCIVNQEIMQPHYFTEISSSTSSSSSCSATQFSSSQPFSSLPSHAAGYLFGDHILFTDVGRDQDPDQDRDVPPKFTRGDEVTEERACEAAASSSGNSFVEAILDRDSEMQLEFPEFLNDYFNY